MPPTHHANGSGPNGLALDPCRLRSQHMAKPLGVAGRAFIRRPDESVLLLRRTAQANHGAGLWELPGGKIRHGEPLASSLAREITEECGLDVHPERAVHVGHQFVDPFWVTTITYDCGHTEQPVVLGDEHSEYLWTPAGQVEALSVTDGTVEQVRAGVRSTARMLDSSGMKGACDDV